MMNKSKNGERDGKMKGKAKVIGWVLWGYTNKYSNTHTHTHGGGKEAVQCDNFISAWGEWWGKGGACEEGDDG